MAAGYPPARFDSNGQPLDVTIVRQLVKAIRQDDVAAAEKLLDSGKVDINDALIGTGEAALHIACWYGASSCLDMLLARGARVNQTASYGRTPTFIASSYGHLHLMPRLLEAGADIDFPNEEGITPLAEAVQEGWEHVVTFFLEAGADHSIADEGEVLPIDRAKEKRDSAMVKQLENYHMPPRVRIDETLTKDALLQRDEHGLCALDANITWYRWHDVSALLAERGETLSKEELDSLGRDGKSYVVRAAELGLYPQLLEVLSEQGEYISQKDFLDENGEPTALLETLIASGDAVRIFKTEYWWGESMAAVRAVYKKLPEEQQYSVGSLHMMAARLPSTHHKASSSEPAL